MTLPFTPRLRIVISTAEARNAAPVSCVDLLAGIISIGNGVAANLLTERGIKVSDLPPESGTTADTGEFPTPYSAPALTALSGAFADAVRRSHTLVGVEHLLTGLLRAPSPDLLDLFQKKAVSLDDLLTELDMALE